MRNRCCCLTQPVAVVTAAAQIHKHSSIRQATRLPTAARTTDPITLGQGSNPDTRRHQPSWTTARPNHQQRAIEHNRTGHLTTRSSLQAPHLIAAWSNRKTNWLSPDMEFTIKAPRKKRGKKANTTPIMEFTIKASRKKKRGRRTNTITQHGRPLLLCLNEPGHCENPDCQQRVMEQVPPLDGETLFISQRCLAQRRPSWSSPSKRRGGRSVAREPIRPHRTASYFPNETERCENLDCEQRSDPVVLP